MKFQYLLMGLQRALEDTFVNLGLNDLKDNSKLVALCDRGLMDGSAYMDPAEW
jgi:hypothetical protein